MVIEVLLGILNKEGLIVFYFPMHMTMYRQTLVELLGWKSALFLSASVPFQVEMCPLM